MSLRVLAIIISIQFLAFTVVPSILAVVDDSYDISLLINSSEEEEKKLKDFENPSKETIECDFYLNNLGDSLRYHQDNYNSLFKEHVSPPPEL